MNRGLLPKTLSALIERRAGPEELDVLAGNVAMERPATRIIRWTSKQIYATRANRERNSPFPKAGTARWFLTTRVRRKSRTSKPSASATPLPEMPLILNPDLHVMVPLESTYQATWDASPEAYRQAVETGVMPNAGPE